MNILAFDTSATACSVGLQYGDQVQLLHKFAPRQQAQLILPMIQELLASFSLSLNQLDAIAYGCGPGSFTGIRIASCVAQGMAYAAQLPVIQISSLAILAQAAYLEQQTTQALIAVDARMQQIYWGMYTANSRGNMELIGQERVCSPDEIPAPNGVHWRGIGDGWENYRHHLVARLGFQPEEINVAQLPSAAAIISLAKEKYDHKEWVVASQATPIYLR